MIFRECPEDFNPKFEIVSVFCEHDGKIVLLHRDKNKPQGNTWGVPTGKVDDGEDIREALSRELAEETGISIGKEQFNYFTKVYVRYPDYDFVYHIFHIKLPQKHDVKTNGVEHKDSVWVKPEDALKMPLIQDLDACIKLFYGLN